MIATLVAPSLSLDDSGVSHGFTRLRFTLCESRESNVSMLGIFSIAYYISFSKVNFIRFFNFVKFFLKIYMKLKKRIFN